MERKIEERTTNQKNVPVTEIDHETPQQSLDELKIKTTDSLEEQETKTIVFSPIGDGDEIINNTPKENKRLFTNKEDNVHEDNCGDGRNETEREGGGAHSGRKK